MVNEAARAVAVPSLVRFAFHVGVPPDALLRAAGLDLERVGNPADDVPQEVKLRLWDEAARLAGDPDFGLHMAEWMSLHPEEHFDVLAYAVRSCATLGEHYRRMARYIRLIHTDAFLSLDVEPDAARLAHGLLDGRLPPRQPVECMLALAVLQGRRAVGGDLAPREVCFAHASPGRVSEQERVFQAPVRYGCPRNEIVLDPAELERPQRQAEPGLLVVLDRQLEGLLSQVPEAPSVPGRVKCLLTEHLLDGEPTLSAVAVKLKMSSRSLQRRLKDEGTSFGQLLADLRRELAQHHLPRPGMTINEVAFLLGFAEVSAFHRAFKRWTGSTPADFQRAARSA